MRDLAALRHGSGRGHVPSGDDIARARAETMARRFRAALAATKDGGYVQNPNRLQHYYQFQVILKPSPPDIQELYLESLVRLGIDPLLHDIRFIVEDDWESATLSALGARLGGVVRRHGGLAVHLFPAGRRLRLRSGFGRVDLWA